MARLSISRAWVEAREQIRRDFNLYLSVALALLVLPQTVVGLIAPGGELRGGTAGTAALLSIVAALIGLVGQLAMVRLATVPRTSVGEAIGHGARRLLPTFAALLLFAVLLALVALPLIFLFTALGWIEMDGASPTGAAAGKFGLALLLLLLLAVALSARLLMLVPVSSAEQPGPVQVLRRSWALTAGHYGRLLGFLLLILVLAFMLVFVAEIVGGITARLVGGDIEPMTVGALIAAAAMALAQAVFGVISTVMLARIYVQLAGAGDRASPTVPSSGT